MTHAPSASVRESACCITARAHSTSRRRRLRSPRLLMPSKVGLPPVLYWRGTSPIEAENCRALTNCRASPSSIAKALAVIGPIPGISSSRWLLSSSLSAVFSSARPA